MFKRFKDRGANPKESFVGFEDYRVDFEAPSRQRSEEDTKFFSKR